MITNKWSISMLSNEYVQVFIITETKLDERQILFDLVHDPHRSGDYRWGMIQVAQMGRADRYIALERVFV